MSSTPSVTSRSPALDASAVGVVVPAHNESASIAACVRALQRAERQSRRRGLDVHLVFVLDACTDDTRDKLDEALSSTPGLGTVIEVDHRNVGRARDDGMALALQRAGGRPSRLWLGTTDADSTVPADWLDRHLRWRSLGAHAVAGTVEVADWSGHSAGTRSRFLHHQTALGTGHGHGHVHGANLGVAADALVDVGGLHPIRLAEDHALWGALHEAGRPRVAAGDMAVTTSARRLGRADGGFSTFLRSLEDADQGPDEQRSTSARKSSSS